MRVIYFTLLVSFAIIQMKCSEDKDYIELLQQDQNLSSFEELPQQRVQLGQISSLRALATSSSSSSTTSSKTNTNNGDKKVIIIVVCCIGIPFVLLIAIVIYCRRKRLRRILELQKDAQQRMENNMANLQQISMKQQIPASFGIPAYPPNQYQPPIQMGHYGQPMFGQQGYPSQNIPPQVTLQQQPYGYPPRI